MSYSTELLCFSYACSIVPEQIARQLKCSNKILLPDTILHDISNNDNITFPLFFNIQNKENKLNRVCAVHEFTAPPGVCNIPFYIMNELGISEGENIILESVSPVKGSFLKLRPHKTEFIELGNPKAILEKVMSKDYPVVHEGRTIAIHHKELNKTYYIDVLETQPAPVVQITNSDINVDFDKPLDYVEPKPPSPVNKKIDNSNNVFPSAYSKAKKYGTNTGFVPFSGKGNRLGDS